MLKNVLRVYDKNEKYTNTGKCYFVVLPDEYDPNNDWHFREYIYPIIARISGMGWQSYTSYMEGTADIAEGEMFWSEITGYELKECKIDINRVNIMGCYKLPEELL